MFSFTITHTDSKSGARLGRLQTPHGAIDTPNFIFCATKGAIKGASMDVMKRAGTDIILSNTYHLLLQPGADAVEALGGLHGMTGWQGPMLTDSGGFQVFSMAYGGFSDEIKGKGKTGSRPNTMLGIEEDGVSFQSYLDGARFKMTPESSMRTQRQLGADLIMAFDECTAFQHGYDYTANSLQRTHRWAKRCVEEFTKINTDGKQALYGIIQGGVFRDLREEGAAFINEQGFFGTAVGGSYGKTKSDLYEILSWVAPHLKREGKPPRPVHLLGIGDIGDVFHAVRNGIDTLDCVQPTRLGRHGFALMPNEPGGRINLRNARFARDTAVLDPLNRHAPTAHYQRGYLHHLIKAEEILAIQILVEHNVAMMNLLMREVRAGIKTGTLDEVERRWTANLPVDETAREYGAARA
jgi:queuine tRNA-ribosyltransferase